ncbi:MAG TPA: PAS domain-containing protein [Candidatus Desulfovibrio intestinavium]|uniref:PAS domain-containing protein n=1 Tax=Candidatus Desulfovibrio intestinavium TaxID=2838534 RepID=A0A9D2KS04_9BACT|nr:PAS domain-containing protein [Candidatus Desulfovibrio intestinavium]
MSTYFPEMPRKLRWTKRQLVIGSILFFLLVVAFCYALCQLEISRTEQEIFSARNRFLLSKMDTMQQRLQFWRSDILDQVQNVRTSEAIRLFVQDMATLPADLLHAPEASRETLDEGQQSLLEQRDYMQRLLADMARGSSSIQRISLFLPDGSKIVDSAASAAPSFTAQLVQLSMASRQTLFSSLEANDEDILLGVAAPLLELSGVETPAVIGCAVFTFKMNTFLFTLLHDKEVLLELADISPQGQSVFFVQDNALCMRPLADGARTSQSQTFAKRAGLRGDAEVYSLIRLAHLPDSFLLEAAIPARLVDDEISRKSLIVYLGAVIGCAGVALLLAFGVSFLAGRAHQAMAAYFKTLYTLIRDQKQLLDSINASLQVGIVLFSPQGGIRLFTPEFARICGMLGHDQPEGTALDDIFPAEAARTLRDGIARKQQDASADDVEISLTGQDGEQRLYRVSLSLFSGDEGGETHEDALSVVAMFNDITQFRKKALQAKALQRNLMDALIRAVENVDPNLVGHSLKMEQVAAVLSRHMGLDAPDVTTLHMAARLCQIGKIFVPHELLQKSGKLTDEEQQAVLRSTEYAFNILKGIPFGLPVSEAVYDMNEKFDGSGPRGLKGMDINIHSRILAIVNAFCSMTSDRAYRSGMPIEQALDILSQSDAFDPDIVQTLRHIPPQELRAALEKQEDTPQGA